MDKNIEVINKVVKEHFKHPDKELKEIFEECTEGLSAEEKEIFYKKVKEIIN